MSEHANRLRKIADLWGDELSVACLKEAADHIEAQAARIAELEAERDELRASIIAYQHMHDHLGSGDIETGRAWDRMRRVVNMGIRKERAEAVRKGGG